MKKKYLSLILIVSVIGFATGFYLKFIKSYTDEKLQGSATTFLGENVDRQLNINETIAFLEKLESIKASNKIDSNENDNALKWLKTINLLSIIAMVISLILAFWITKKLLSKEYKLKESL